MLNVVEGYEHYLETGPEALTWHYVTIILISII